ncbi:hypothetical protein KCU64_g11259, partial [Aureobasidium melanogenum]
MSARITTPTHKPSRREVDSKSSSVPSPRGPPKAVSSLAEKPSSEHFGAVVTDEVGPEKKAFVIHKDLLFFYSDHFRTAFKGSFKEAIEGKLSLPDADADLFYIVNGFLYTRQLRQQDNRMGPNLNGVTLGDLWVFGDRYLMPLLQNTVMDAYIKKASMLNSFFTSGTMTRRYRQTSTGSQLRRFLVDWQAHRSIQFKEVLEQWPQEALADLAIKLSSMKPEHRGINRLPDDRDKCSVAERQAFQFSRLAKLIVFYVIAQELSSILINSRLNHF